MKRGLSLLLLGLLGGTAAAQEGAPPDYSRAEINAAIQYCLETIKELEASTQRFPIEEFGSPFPTETPDELLTRCVIYQLENGDVEVIPLA